MSVARITFAAVFSVMTCMAYAGEAEDLQQLLRARQFAQAVERADKFLAKTPKDAQVRFLRAIALTEMGRNEDAIKAFNKLSEDYPHLPEPYNNLAVLYANTKQFDKARTALQMAIQTNPSYAIAHENMGDLYARLASQAYDKALQIENSNSQLQTKLKLVGTLFNPNQAPATRIAAAQTTTIPLAAKVLPAANKTQVSASANIGIITPQPTLPAIVPSKTTAPKATATVLASISPTVAPKSTPTATPKSTPTTTPKATSTPNADKEQQQQVIASVEDWANAWSKQNVGAYVNSYAKSFKAPGGRAAWEKDRQSKIAGPKSIDVKVSKFKVSMIDDNNAKVTLRQSYKSDRLSSNTTKTLIMQKSGNRWLILEERIGG
ncbi:tetratricopeptide repeat protein [Deefgea piscis]|uniref:tetratricopeptide repeat protein n=1 Tax=Deefgea piscis TaxID=2739061 RepID=UPI001C7EE4B8|nr:tetratricopeptide repeat protein [Deefgea piscis]QZA82195.1 tetratricopeptide repeat protein [Deefgea piscis]